MNLTRRSFIGLVSAAIIASAAGIELTPEQKKYIARHIYAYDLNIDRYHHRIDVWIQVLGEQQQYGVDFYPKNKIPTEEEMRPALETLEAAVKRLTGRGIEALGPPKNIGELHG